MNWGTKIYTWFYGNLVGEDEFGNKYYSNLKDFNDKNAKRWVIFNGVVEASKIPPHWHAWLHKSIESPPLNYKHKYEWQQDHQPNVTGTIDAYHPRNHPASKSKLNLDEKEYERWNP